MLRGLSRIDLTNCSEDEARERLLKGVEGPAPPQRKPAFERVAGEAPDEPHAGPAEKPVFVRVKTDDGVPRWLSISAAVAGVVAALFAGLTLFFGDHATERECKTIMGGTVVCGNVNIQKGP